MNILALSGRESSLVQTFCESCVHLDITHPSVHMTRRFVIQGCPTLTKDTSMTTLPPPPIIRLHVIVYIILYHADYYITLTPPLPIHLGPPNPKLVPTLLRQNIGLRGKLKEAATGTNPMYTVAAPVILVVSYGTTSC